MMLSFNFSLRDHHQFSRRFLELNIGDFMGAASWIKSLPYQRNLDKEDPFCVFNDLAGTCSSKHALLKRLALETNISDLKLMLGILKMNAFNTPKIRPILEKYKLPEIPEAHNYLKFKDQIGDFTFQNSQPENFIEDLIQEIEIQPDQITTFKVEYHQNFLRNYLRNRPEIKLSLNEIWKIREDCIAAL